VLEKDLMFSSGPAVVGAISDLSMGARPLWPGIGLVVGHLVAAAAICASLVFVPLQLEVSAMDALKLEATK
jgi:uncharacterized membrane protein YccF (DUF307 family)